MNYTDIMEMFSGHPAIRSMQKFQFCNLIESEVLKIVTQLMKEVKSQEDYRHIQSIAKKTTELIKPGMELEELYDRATKLDDLFPELTPVVAKAIRDYEERYHKKALDNVSGLIRNGRLDEAEDMVKKVLQFKFIPA